MSVTSWLGALAQCAVALASGWMASHLALTAAHRTWERMGLAERALLAVVGFVGVCVALMVAHIVTGGAAFGVTWPVPVALAALLWSGARRRPWPGALPWRGLSLAAGVLAAIYVAPMLASGSGLRTGDIPWHMGWTEQLLGGRPVPTGPAPGVDANAYPWGFHAVLATMVRSVPGTDVTVALHALALLLVAALPLAGACLARRVRADAGWAGAFALALVGGFGWIGARGAFFSTSPSEAPFGADLVVASPNAVYELLPPALPRELGLVLLAAFGVLLALAVAAPGRRAGMAAGVAAGLTGLVSVPTFLAAALWTLLGVVAAPRGARLRLLGAVALGAVPVLALWAGPVVASYVRLGGFVNVTPQLGREWPLPVALASWGLVAVGAPAGATLAWRRRAEPAVRCILLMSAATMLLLGLSLVRDRLGWGLGGNATLLHQGRVWPAAHLLAAALAGAALAAAWAALRARSRSLALAAAAVVMALGAASPAVASIGLARTMRAGEGGFVFGRADVGEGSFVSRAGAALGPGDVVRVEGPRLLALLLWSYSGARLAAYDDPRLAGNDLRIRYRDLAAAWDRRAAGRGFPATHRLVPAGASSAPVLLEGRFGGRRWALVAS